MLPLFPSPRNVTKQSLGRASFILSHVVTKVFHVTSLKGHNDVRILGAKFESRPRCLVPHYQGQNADVTRKLYPWEAIQSLIFWLSEGLQKSRFYNHFFERILNGKNHGNHFENITVKSKCLIILP